MILDVGCGDKPKGDVNVDLTVGHTLQGGNQKKEGIYINPKTIPNFVRADSCHLPFREGTFDKVVSYHVIEHVASPALMLKELLRVSNREVEIKCPHRLSKFAKLPYHINYFNTRWFEKALQSLGVKYEITVTFDDRIGHYTGSINWYNKITACAHKIRPSHRIRPYTVKIYLPHEITVKLSKYDHPQKKSSRWWRVSRLCVGYGARA